MKKKIFKVLLISLKVLGITFLVLSILPYLLPINQQKVNEAEGPFAESHFMRIDGKRWHYRQLEPKDSFRGNVILIHGFSGSTFSWRNNQQALVDSGYRVLMVDLPAFGFSEKEHNAFDHSTQAHGRNIWRLLDSLNLGKTAWHIAGHSMGAGVAWSMAGLEPSRTATVFLIDGAGSMGMSGRRSWGTAIFTFCLRYPPLLRWVDVLAGRFFFKQQKFEELLTSAYSMKADSAAAAGYMRPFLIKNSGPAVFESFIYSKAATELDYSQLKAPIHLIWGSNDNWVPLSLGKKFKEKYPTASLQIVEGAGHCPMETHPTEVNKILLDALRN